jgi:phosphatidylcholine synthase
VTGPWLVHLFTASGIVFAFLAAASIFEHDYRAAFAWLAAQMAVDAVDGVLARRADVRTRIPWFDGAKLDDIIDFVSYVFVPALFVWRALIVPDAWSLPVAAAMLLSSAYGFSRTDAKTADHFFTGFPSYWNIAAFYLFVAEWPPEVNAAILLALAVLVFVPVRYVYPSRTPVLQTLTTVLGIGWAALMLVMLWQHPDIPPIVLLLSAVYPVYYTGLSLALHWRRYTRNYAGT